MIVQEKMGQLLHKVWHKQCTGGHETQFGDGAAIFIPGRSLWVSYDGGSHSVLQVFQTTFICYPHYLLKLWCRGSQSSHTGPDNPHLKTPGFYMILCK